MIDENIKFIRKQKKLTQQKFADLIGIKRSSLGAYEEGRAKPNYQTLGKIAAICKISIDRLIKENLAETANKTIFGKEDPQKEAPTNNNYGTPNPFYGMNPANSMPYLSKRQKEERISGNNLRILPVTVDASNEPNIALVPDKAAAGYLQGLADKKYIEQLPVFNLPFFTNGTYRAFEIEGDSMLPLESGTIIIGEYVENWSDIKNNQTYIVISQNEGIVFKRVTNNLAATDSLILRSDNPAYPPYQIKSADILEVWAANAYISRSMPDNATTLDKLMETIIEMQNEIVQLKSKIGI